MKFPSIQNWLGASIMAFKRFPFAMASAIVAVFSVMLLIEKQFTGHLPRFWMMAQLGIPLFTALQVLVESRKLQKTAWILIIPLLATATLVLYGWLLPNFDQSEHIIRYMVLLLTAHLLVSFAPYLNEKPVADFWEYNKQLFANIIIGGAYTFILWGGLSMAIFAVNRLFALDLDEKIYLHLMVLLAGLFNTTFFLYHFPQDFEFDQYERSYTLVFSTLSKFILIPIVVLYFVILYAYSAKILFSWSLPIGWVSSLVIGFSVAGILTYLLNYMLPEYDESKIPPFYKKWFWRIMLPMVLLLFVAIGRRITDYGITEGRFMVAHVGVWLLLCGLYFVISKNDNIKFIPISLAIFGLTAVLGPFSAFQVSFNSQKNILKNVLIENDRFAEGRMKPSAKPVSKEATQKIYAILDYFNDRKSLSVLQNWLPTPIANFKSDKISTIDSIAHWMNINDRYPHGSIHEDRRELNLTFGANGFIGPVGDYNQMYYIALQPDLSQDNDAFFFRFNSAQSGLEFCANKSDKIEVLDTYILKYKMQNWLKQHDEGYISIPSEESAIELKGAHSQIKLVLNELVFYAEHDTCYLQKLNGVLLYQKR